MAGKSHKIAIATGLTALLALALGARSVLSDPIAAHNGGMDNSVKSFSIGQDLKDDPTRLDGVGVDEKFGESLDLNLLVRDESGKNQPLKNYFDGTRPVIVNLVYFYCPRTCSVIINSTLTTAKKLEDADTGLRLGKDFRILNISFNPKETSEVAAAKRTSYAKEFSLNTSENDAVNFVTADEATIKAVTNSLGFRYKWDDEMKEYIHANLTHVLSGEGKICRYLYGISFEAQDLRLAVTEAGQGKVGTFKDRVLQFCYAYNPAAKGYVRNAMRLMSAAGAVTLFLVVLFLGSLWYAEARKEEQAATLPPGA
jgi:protein SCO1